MREQAPRPLEETLRGAHGTSPPTESRPKECALMAPGEKNTADTGVGSTHVTTTRRLTQHTHTGTRPASYSKFNTP